jgi:folate-binding protein YgfZ
MNILNDFGDPRAEYRAACEQAALFDLSDRGKIELAGKEAVFFLNNLCTNDVKNLAVGAGCEAFLCTAKAKVVAHIFVSHYQKDVLLLDFEPGQTEKVFKHLNHYLISEQVEITDRSSELQLIHVCGPNAPAILEKAVGKPLADLPPLRLDLASYILIRRNDSLGLPGFDLFYPPEKWAEIWDSILNGGAVLAGLDALEMLRIEAGTPVYGKDIDENRLVMEVGRTQQAICYTKGCFLGQEPIVMARDRGHVNRTLLGIRFDGETPAARRTRLFRDGAEVGQVTSSVISYRLGPIALAYLKRGHQEPGTIVELDPTTDGREASISALPFALP